MASRIWRVIRVLTVTVTLVVPLALSRNPPAMLDWYLIARPKPASKCVVFGWISSTSLLRRRWTIRCFPRQVKHSISPYHTYHPRRKEEYSVSGAFVLPSYDATWHHTECPAAWQCVLKWIAMISKWGSENKTGNQTNTHPQWFATVTSVASRTCPRCKFASRDRKVGHVCYGNDSTPFPLERAFHKFSPRISSPFPFTSKSTTTTCGHTWTLWIGGGQGGGGVFLFFFS